MKLVAGAVNSQFLESVLLENMDACSRVRAAIAHAGDENRPYAVGDDLGDNTVEARIWLGGSSHGFE